MHNSHNMHTCTGEPSQSQWGRSESSAQANCKAPRGQSTNVSVSYITNLPAPIGFSLSISLALALSHSTLSLSLSISRSPHHSIPLSFSHILYYHRIPRNRSHSRSVWLYIQQVPSSDENPRHRCKSTCHCSRFSRPAGACIDWYVKIGHDIFSNPWCMIHSYNHMSVLCVI